MPAPLWASNIGGSSPRYGVDDEDDGTAFRTQSMSRVARHDCQLMRLQGDRTANFDVEKSRPFEAAEQLIAVGMGMEIRSLVRDDAEADIQSIDCGEVDVLPSVTHCVRERLKIVFLKHVYLQFVRPQTCPSVRGKNSSPRGLRVTVFTTARSTISPGTEHVADHWKYFLSTSDD